MSRHRLVPLVIAAAVAAAAPGGASGADVQQALDRPITVDIGDGSIREVFATLGKAAGVEFLIETETLAALPYGAQTRMRVSLKNITLRRALPEILTPQALRWEIRANVVRILPSAPLARMNRRATYDELAVLGKIQSVKLTDTKKGQTILPELRRATGSAELRLLPHVRIDEEADYARAGVALPGTGADWLDMLCHGKGWTWYLSGEAIVVLDKTEQVKRQLQQHVTLRPRGQNLQSVLLELAQKAGIKLTFDPGVMKLLPEEICSGFNLSMSDATIEQALEAISGATGLKFVAEPQGVRVAASEALTKQPATMPSRPKVPFFLKMSVPGPGGTSLDVYIRADELPDDMVELLDKHKAVLLRKLRAELKRLQAR